MSNVAQFHDESPTAKRDNLPSTVLGRLARIRRLAQLAMERIEVSPDKDALEATCCDLALIEALAVEAAS